MKRLFIATFMIMVVILLVYFVVLPLRSNSCSEDEVLLRNKVELANNCETQSDCKVQMAGFNCPFGCHYLFNKEVNLKELSKEVNDYVTKCYPGNPVCEQCLTPPPQENVKCIDNKCVDVRFDNHTS